MKRLFVLRHAKAVPAAGPMADSARPLAERGERDARRIGERLREHGARPTLIVSSPAVRAMRTAEIVAVAVGYRLEDIAQEGRLYLAEPAAIVAIVSAQPAHAETLLLVGHNPGLTELVHRLEPKFDVADLPTAAIVGLDYSIDAWDELERVVPKLAYYDYPKSSAAPLTRR